MRTCRFVVLDGGRDGGWVQVDVASRGLSRVAVLTDWLQRCVYMPLNTNKGIKTVIDAIMNTVGNATIDVVENALESKSKHVLNMVSYVYFYNTVVSLE